MIARNTVVALVMLSGTVCLGTVYMGTVYMGTVYMGTAYLGTAYMGTAYAADTTEPFALGFTDAEFYGSLSGLGETDKAIGSEMVIGVGLTDRVAITFGFSAEGTDELVETGSAKAFGLFYNAVDTEHFDLDLTFSIGAGQGDVGLGPGIGEVGIGPGMELNLDRANDQAKYGAYLRAGLPMGPGDGERVTSVELNPGAYYTLCPKAQAFVEYSQAFEIGEDPETAGRVSLGFNRILGGGVELISEVGVDDGAYDVQIGFIATVPAK